MFMTTPISAEQRAHFIELWRQDVSMRLISKKMEIGYEIVRRLVREHLASGDIQQRHINFSKRPRANRQRVFNAQQSAEIFREYSNGVSVSAIAARLRTNGRAIRRVLDAFVTSGALTEKQREEHKWQAYRRTKRLHREMVQHPSRFLRAIYEQHKRYDFTCLNRSRQHDYQP